MTATDAFAGVAVLRSSLPNAVAALREFSSDAGSGLGTFSAGVSDLVLQFVLPVLAIVLNRTLARWARTSSQTVRVVHRVHTWWILPSVLLIVAGVIAFAVRPGPLLFMAIPIDSVLWGVFLLLTAALLGMYAVEAVRPF